MNPTLVDQVVQAVLYEGYALYPYRPSVKSRCRWTFGGIYPPAYVNANPGADASRMQMQCLVSGPGEARVRGQVRFLHLLTRTGASDRQAWQEAVERQVPLDDVRLDALCERPQTRAFAFSASLTADAEGPMPAVRQQQAVRGEVGMGAERVAERVFRITVRIENLTELDPRHACDRDQAVLRSLASTHIVLNTDASGRFVSLTDPPDALAGFARECNNQGCWPVLVGEPGEADALLASPIILSDYPQLAPESPGDLFDGTEIDEILSLRILTLTDEEKRQAVATDDRVRRMLERTESLAREQLTNLHGTIRGLRPVAPIEEQRHA